MVTQATAREAARLIIRRTALQVHPQQMMLLQNQVPEAARQGPQLRSSTTYCVCSIYMYQSFQVQQIITCSATSS